jgi:hypothetical protein
MLAEKSTDAKINTLQMFDARLKKPRISHFPVRWLEILRISRYGPNEAGAEGSVARRVLVERAGVHVHRQPRQA